MKELLGISINMNTGDSVSHSSESLSESEASPAEPNRHLDFFKNTPSKKQSSKRVV